MIDLTTIFRDPQRWRRFRTDRTAPHALYVAHNSDGGKVAALVLRRTRADGDWAISAEALNYLSEALRDGRIAQGHVVLCDRWNVVGRASVSEVVAHIGDTPPNSGPWGEYHWLNSTFEPVVDYRTAVDDEEPF